MTGLINDSAAIAVRTASASGRGTGTLEQETARTSPQRGMHIFVEVEGRDDGLDRMVDCGRGRQSRNVETVYSRHSSIDERHIRAQVLVVGRYGNDFAGRFVSARLPTGGGREEPRLDHVGELLAVRAWVEIRYPGMTFGRGIDGAADDHC